MGPMIKVQFCCVSQHLTPYMLCCDLLDATVKTISFATKVIAKTDVPLLLVGLKTTQKHIDAESHVLWSGSTA